MPDETPNLSPEEIAKRLGDVVGEPDKFIEIMGSFNSLFEGAAHHGQRSFGDVEAAALTSVAAMSDVKSHASVGRQVGEMLEKFESPAYLVRESGQIMAQNSAAFATYNLGTNATLADLPLALEMDAQINKVVRASLEPGKNSYDAVLKRAYATDDDHPLTLSITPSKPMVDGEGEALVFVVNSRWKTAAAGLIKREFDLTEAERELLESFLDGQSTQDMAKQRGRSHATIRTQFHSLMTKMGARTQTELFRNALSVSQFVDKISAIAEVLRHPHRKRADILRPGGRSVEVTMAGDFSGLPVVFLANSFIYRFESKNEQILHDAGLCMFSICKPGYGDTDPPVPGDCPIETAANDIEALLDQLGHEKTVLMTTNNASPFMYKLSALLEHRLSGLVPCSAFLPPNYFDEENCLSTWVKGTTRAVRNYPSVAEFLIKAGVPAWTKMGAKRFYTVQFKAHVKTLQQLLAPTYLAESQHALETSTKQQTIGAASEIRSAFDDFTNDIAATDLPILLIHGDKDEAFPISGVRRFAHDNPARAQLLELTDVGSAAVGVHSAEIFDAVKTLLTRKSPQS